jgi:hypothetical protein
LRSSLMREHPLNLEKNVGKDESRYYPAVAEIEQRVDAERANRSWCQKTGQMSRVFQAALRVGNA